MAHDCWDIRRSRAPSGISGIEVDDALAKAEQLTSELQGQSGIALPLPTHPSCAMSGRGQTAGLDP